MPRRFTITEKWDDAWFHNLSWRAKMLWWYLYEKCDNAGFWEINWSTARFDTGVKDIDKALPELGSRLKQNDQFLWIRRFLMAQGNWPLNNKVPPHRQIIALLKAREHVSKEITAVLNGEEPNHCYVGVEDTLFKGLGKGNERVTSKGKGNSIGIGKGNKGGVGGDSSPPAIETFSHQATNAGMVISAWQKLPLKAELKQTNDAVIMRVEQLLSELDLDPVDPVHLEMVLSAIANYDKALRLPDSQSYQHSIIRFLGQHMRKTYLDGVFNLENHKRCNFDKKFKPPRDKDAEDAASTKRLNAKRAEQRQEYSAYFRERILEELTAMRQDKKAEIYWWLIDEIIAEKKAVT